MRMEQIVLNGQALRMPAVALGTVFFGTRVAEDEAFGLMDAYYEAGGRWIDTARVYCTQLFKPEERLPSFCDSEEVIGRWIRARELEKQVTVITKGAHWNLADHAMRVKPECILHDFQTSLNKLGLDKIDIYFLHNDDASVPVGELVDAMNQVYASGRAGAIGVSNWQVSRIMEANRYAQAHGLVPFSISQVKWSYALPTAQAPAGSINMEGDPSQYRGYCEMNMPVMAYSSQARGFFMKVHERGFKAEGLGSAAPFLSEANRRRAEAVFEVAQSWRISIAAASFSYQWSREVPVTVLVGPSNVDQLRDSLRDCDYKPDADVAEVLNAAR